MGRLLRAEVPGKVIHYAHDGRGRRIGRVVSVGGGPATLDKAWIYRDALNPIAQLDSSGTMEAVYLYGTRANVPDAIVTATGTYRVVSDHLGSVRMVIDQAGTVVEEWDYDAYGNVVSSSGSTGLHPFGFAGGITDADTGMVRFGARDYEPGTGKWTARDPIKFDGGRNHYNYSESAPSLFTDPTGLDIWIEGPSGDEPPLHLSINIGDPFGEYTSISFAANNFGQVYEDVDKGGEIIRYIQTSPEEDAWAYGYLQATEDSDNERWYGSTTCRNYSHEKFEELKEIFGKQETAPPHRAVAPTSTFGYVRLLIIFGGTTFLSRGSTTTPAP